MLFKLAGFFFTFFILITSSMADTIILRNGDRISGKLIKKETDKVILKSEYAGEIAIQWSAVESLDTNSPVQVMLEDRTFINGRLEPDGQNRVLLKSDQFPTPMPILLTQVQYLNPSPEISGNGIKVKGHINGGISITDGNTETEQYNLDTEVIIRSRQNRFTTTAALYRAKEDGLESENKSSLGLKYDHFLSKKNYLYGNTSFMKDKFKDLKLRSTIGFGYGYQFFEGEERNLSLEGGLNYVNDDFISATDEDYAAARWALKYDQWVFRNKTQFFHKHEGLVDLTHTENITLTSQTGLRFPLIAGLNASTQINADWENTPSPGAEKTDLKYLLNIGYAW